MRHLPYDWRHPLLKGSVLETIPIHVNPIRASLTSFIFPSQKMVARSKDLNELGKNMDPLKPLLNSLKDNVQTFSERLEALRERIENASRLHHLLTIQMQDECILQEISRLAETLKTPSLLERCRDIIKKATTQLVFARTLHSTPWESNIDLPSVVKEVCCERNLPKIEDDEEDNSKKADSGLGSCDRCEGHMTKLMRSCSCQSIDEANNACNNTDELEDDSYESEKHDLQAPLPVNAHLTCHASDLKLSKKLDCDIFDEKTQK